MHIPDDVVAAKRAISDRLLRPAVRATAMVAFEHRVVTAVDRASRNVHAVGVGRKRVGGADTEDAAVRIYVAQKLPLTLLPPDERLPSQIDGIPVDVVESPPALLMNATGCSENRKLRQRPVLGGISAAHRDVTAGTIACICHSTAKDDDPEDLFLLSNYHVFGASSGNAGDPVLQPAPLDGGVAADQIAVLHRAVPVVPGGADRNCVDGAIARISPGVPCSPAVCTLGDITGTAVATDGTRVRKHGRTSGYTEGMVTDESYDVVVGMDLHDSSIVALFHEQLRIERVDPFAIFAMGGDSGSLVVESEAANAVGLYFAGPSGGAYGVANHIADVMDELRIRIP